METPQNTTLQTKKYVLGFAFWRDQVALIYKTKGPEYVIDTWNGIGGKIESYEEYAEFAMAREFKEETGVPTLAHHWHKIAVQKGKSWDGPGYELHILKYQFLSTDARPRIHNEEEGNEVVQWFGMAYIPPNITPNLKWILPLVLDETTGYLEIVEH